MKQWYQRRVRGPNPTIKNRVYSLYPIPILGYHYFRTINSIYITTTMSESPEPQENAIFGANASWADLAEEEEEQQEQQSENTNVDDAELESKLESTDNYENNHKHNERREHHPKRFNDSSPHKKGKPKPQLSPSRNQENNNNNNNHNHNRKPQRSPKKATQEEEYEEEEYSHPVRRVEVLPDSLVYTPPFQPPRRSESIDIVNTQSPERTLVGTTIFVSPPRATGFVGSPIETSEEPREHRIVVGNKVIVRDISSTSPSDNRNTTPQHTENMQFQKQTHTPPKRPSPQVYRPPSQRERDTEGNVDSPDHTQRTPHMNATSPPQRQSLTTPEKQTHTPPKRPSPQIYRPPSQRESTTTAPTTSLSSTKSPSTSSPVTSPTKPSPSPSQTTSQRSATTTQPATHVFEPSVDGYDFPPVVGTSTVFQKPYLRLTSKPDPSTVRSIETLRSWFPMLLRRYKSKEKYAEVSSELKSIRQDLMVQRIETHFTLEVYEAHLRLAVENQDQPEIAVCLSRIKELGEKGIESQNKTEMTMYRPNH
eukprot:TRINITY_DN1528_c0_g1_i8.p1 TRINITY_DN1528_c0_g1~~TRINITY_DN1528_c0_g1_i8.p1  ORF type:complete len:537 (+),score=133.70 TRINITY_DN1528_c0_g1_i8:423-2033(+)